MKQTNLGRVIGERDELLEEIEKLRSDNELLRRERDYWKGRRWEEQLGSCDPRPLIDQRDRLRDALERCREYAEMRPEEVWRDIWHALGTALCHIRIECDRVLNDDSEAAGDGVADSSAVDPGNEGRSDGQDRVSNPPSYGASSVPAPAAEELRRLVADMARDPATTNESIPGLLTHANERLDRLENIVITLARIAAHPPDSPIPDELERPWGVLEELIATIQNERKERR